MELSLLVPGDISERLHLIFVLLCFRLYAVLGCTQLDSIEYLELDTTVGRADSWEMLPPLTCARHLPGVGYLDTSIYVCGGSDDNWTAYSTVEMFDTR